MTQLLDYTHYPHTSQQSLIIIHGLLGSKDNWRQLAKQLSHAYNVYCVDCRNHGESFHHESMTYEEMSKDIETLCKHLGLTNVSIIGHSMGGKIAMQCIQNTPQQYQKAIIVDIAPKDYNHHHQLILNAMQSIELTQMMSRSLIDTALATTISDQAIRQLLLKNIKRNHDNQFAWKCNIQAIQNNYPFLMANSLKPVTIATPTLFIKGEHSFYINLENDINQINTYFSHAQTQIINGAGHWLQVEKPQEFLEIALKFLNT